MKYSKCDFCQYENHGKCLYPEYFRNPLHIGVKPEESNPCEPAINRMMEIMKCEIVNNNKRRVEVTKNINNGRKKKR